MWFNNKDFHLSAVTNLDVHKNRVSRYFTSILGGTSGLFPFNSLVRNSSFFSSSHSLYVPISKYPVIASSVSACLPDSWQETNLCQKILLEQVAQYYINK